MAKTNSTPIENPEVENAYLVGIQTPDMTGEDAIEHLAELERLAETLGVETLGKTIVKLTRPSSRYLIGSGKAEEITSLAQNSEVDCIVFDEELSPSQQRNWEELSELCVIDRHEVILDIFAAHATTREAVLQVGLARAEYSLPRLTRAWTHLSRQRGGSRGTRGEGEMQLEVDRRIVLRKIARFKRELKTLQRQRSLRRNRRQSIPIPTAAIVGYTNAGKSSLLNALTGAGVGVEDKLFATLDPTTRRLSIQNGHDMLLSDTVGFIRKLPHDLVEAFQSTLEESVTADFLVIVLDASDTAISEQYKTTMEVLDEIGASGKPTLMLLNKCDLLTTSEARESLVDRYPGALFVSALTGAGLSEIAARLSTMEYERLPLTRVVLPATRHDLAALVHRTGRIVDEQYIDDEIVITAQLPDTTLGRLKTYITQ